MDRCSRLTPRQKDCIRLVADGYTSKQIAQFLGVSPATVDNHIRSALGLLQVSNRAEAARQLRLSEDSQRLTSQADDVAKPSLPTQSSTSTIAGSEPNIRSAVSRIVVPIGGYYNDLDTVGKSLAIMRVAGVSLISLLTMTIVLAGALHVFR